MFSLTDATEQLAFLELSSYSSSDVNQCWYERPDPLCIYQSFAHQVDWLLLRLSREHERANWRHSNGRSVHQRQTPRCRPEVRCWSRLRSLSSSVVDQPTWGILWQKGLKKNQSINKHMQKRRETWEESCFTLGVWNKVRLVLRASSPYMANEATRGGKGEFSLSFPTPRTRVPLSRAVLAWLLATPPNGELAHRLTPIIYFLGIF